MLQQTWEFKALLGTLISFCMHIKPAMGFLHDTVDRVLTFWEISVLVFRVAVLTCFLPSSVATSPLFQSLPTLVIIYLFVYVVSFFFSPGKEGLDRISCNSDGPLTWCVAKAGCELLIFLLSPPECWDHRHVPPRLTLILFVAITLKKKSYDLRGRGMGRVGER